MKKIILSIAAVAALAACTKSEVQYEQTGEISFIPVAKTITKSVAGLNDAGVFDGIFPNTIDLYVFANAQDENANGELIDSWKTPYFKKAHFVYDAGKGNESTQFDPAILTTGAYKGETPLYWPNVKTLKFVGYSDACNVALLTPTVAEDLSTLTIEGYVQDNTKTAEGANDLMWFPVTQAYGKAEGEIPAQMKHACSWITVKIIGDGVTGDNYKIQNLKIKNLYHKGKAVCGATEATWSNHAEKANEDLFTAASGATAAALQFPKDKNGEDPNNPKVFENNANNFIVIPQKPTTLDVTYSYVSDATNTITFTETKSVELDYDGSNSEWKSGVHYIYNLTITATEILIDPVVVDWTLNTPTIPAI